MSINLREAFNKLEAQRGDLLGRLEGVNNARLNIKPQPGKWSIMQILCHLTLAEKLSLDYLRKKMAGSKEFEKSGVVSAFKTWALKIFLRSPLKFKAPSRATDLPDEQTFEDTKTQWDEVRQGLRDAIESFPDEMGDAVVFKHPAVGPMNIRQMLSFLREHLSRHARQIEDNLESLG